MEKCSSSSSRMAVISRGYYAAPAGCTANIIIFMLSS